MNSLLSSTALQTSLPATIDWPGYAFWLKPIGDFFGSLIGLDALTIIAATLAAAGAASIFLPEQNSYAKFRWGGLISAAAALMLLPALGATNLALYAGLAAGVALLKNGGSTLIESSASVARKKGWSEAFIGTFIIGFGTSAAELVSSITFALVGNDPAAVTNISGSNIANFYFIAPLGLHAVGIILLISGLWKLIKSYFDQTTATKANDSTSSVQKQFAASSSTTTKIDQSPIISYRQHVDFLDISFFTLSAALLWATARFAGEIGFWPGAGFLTLLIGYGILKYRNEKGTPTQTTIQTVDKEATSQQPKKQPISRDDWLGIAGGLALLIIGAGFVTSAAAGIGLSLGLLQAFIGSSIVAVGTSLPELTAFITAVLVGKKALAVGNIIGSNIFNILGIIGATAMVKSLFGGGPLALAGTALPFIDIMLGATLLALPFVLLQNKKAHVGLGWGAAMIAGWSIMTALTMGWGAETVVAALAPTASTTMASAAQMLTPALG